METEEKEEIPFEFEFRGIDMMILPGFLKLLDSKDIILDFSADDNISVSYSKKALKWIKDVKKKDQFWDEEHFIMRVLYSTTKILSQEELQSKVEGQKVEENNVHNSNPTTDTAISN